jgi:hypothetical protein
VVGGGGATDVGTRLDRLIDAVVRAVYAEERQVRTALRVYHDTWLRDSDTPVRKGRRMNWIDKTISSLPAEARENFACLWRWRSVRTR